MCRTVYSDVRNATTNTNQYSVTENFRDGGPAATGRMLPGVFFFYYLSPSKVGAALRRALAACLDTPLCSPRAPPPPSLPPLRAGQDLRAAELLPALPEQCVRLGGVFTVSGLVDSFVYHGDKLIRKKMEMGKLF
jgi:hypothetical protein